jgi:hypothetical protein
MKPRRLPPSQMPAKAELITCLQEAEAWFVMSSADVCSQLNYRGTLVAAVPLLGTHARNPET